MDADGSSGSLQEVLSGLESMQGLVGAAVVSSAGKFLAVKLPPPYEPVLLTSMLAQLGGVRDVLDSLSSGTKMRAFFARFEDMLMLARWNDRCTVVVLALENANPTVLSVALNTVLTRVDGLLSTTAPPAPALTKATPPTPSPALRAEVPDFVPIETLRSLATLLAAHVGPMSQMLLKREVAALGVTTTTLRRAQFAAFVRQVSAHVPDAAARKAFVDRALTLG